LFPSDLAEQKKKLMQMLATAVTNLHQVEKIIPAVEDLGRRHVAYGVTDKHYEPVGAALLWTLEQGLGPDFTPPVKARLDRNLYDGRRRHAEGRRRGAAAGAEKGHVRAAVRLSGPRPAHLLAVGRQRRRIAVALMNRTRACPGRSPATLVPRGWRMTHRSSALPGTPRWRFLLAGH
jgi:hypothetical protein